ncbi:SNF2-related protein [Frankia sp. Mgl5]|uniref:helicase-related protein n=1 Tax=Frankia sp. Mgl5 TaxID=2933793 RepID=UPI00200DCE4E|nr:helicase-related protein [Frankia sp. Mgl5]MCK9925859.1 SNF2-related protein [Frankia sp. Mgl5]
MKADGNGHVPAGISLEDLCPGWRVTGIVHDEAVVVTAVRPAGSNAVLVDYRRDDGTIHKSVLPRSREADLARVTGSGPFRADPQNWRVAAEALRIRRSTLFADMPAVATSALQPLPHQLLAVYDELLPRSPLRFLLADDPGAGKTITAGLYLKEMMLREDVARCLIVVPGSLIDQWQSELRERFGLVFERLSTDLAATPGSDVFERHPLLLARMDHLSRNNDLLTRLREASEWDLVIVDEAHRMSAHYSGYELRTTRRYELGVLLRERTRHLLLMTATPHAGRHEDFHAFLALLDPDRFEGNFTAADGGAADTTGLMRRFLKEDLRTLDGRPLFPERRAYTVPYQLSPAERELYEAVTDYVRHEMGRADRLRASGEVQRGNTVGFALTILQRRLASSPEAILRSLERRRERLRQQLADSDGGNGGRGDGRLADHVERALAGLWNGGVRSGGVDGALDDILSELDDPGPSGSDTAAQNSMTFGDLVGLEEEVTDAATAARTREELQAEISTLDHLVGMARRVRSADTDRKWSELRTILRDDLRTRDESGQLGKIILFTEHRDTQSYLVERITALLGETATVEFIHGGLPRERRLAAQRRFTSDPRARVLVATDAAGEGVNLQVAHLMVNYDLPWNPNRIEQRFGRIHRIGQGEVCHLWNLVATDTREGDVFHRLLEKIEQQHEAYSGKVFDVLGQAFADRPLRDLLIEAIRYGDSPDVRGRLHEIIDEAVGIGLAELLDERALHTDILAAAQVDELRRRHDAATRHGLAPVDVREFFLAAFPALGGRVEPREPGLYQVLNVPPALRDTRTTHTGQDAGGSPGRRVVHPAYRRVTFGTGRGGPAGPSGRSARSEGTARSEGSTRSDAAELLEPSHPLVEAVADGVLRRARDVLRGGTVFVDPADPGDVPRLLAIVSAEIRDGHQPAGVVSRRLTVVELFPDGTASVREPAPYLRYLELRDAAVVGTALGSGAVGLSAVGPVDAVRAAALAVPGRDAASWLREPPAEVVRTWAFDHLLPAHLDEVRARVQAPAERTRRLVADRLGAEIEKWRAWRADDPGPQRRRGTRTGGDVVTPASREGRISPATARQRAENLEYRLDRRLADIEADLHLDQPEPVVEAVALVVPAGLATRAGVRLPAVPPAPITPSTPRPRTTAPPLSPEPTSAFQPPTRRSRRRWF